MNTHSFPLLLKYLLGIFLAAVVLYFGKTLFIPLFFGLLIAMIMHPVCKWLESHGFNKTMAITVCLFIVTILFAGIFALLIWQLKVFSQEAPALFEKLSVTLTQFQSWLTEKTGLKTLFNGDWQDTIAGSFGGVVRPAVENILNTLFILFLVPVYTALFMYHRKVLVQFLSTIIPARYKEQLSIILRETIHTYFNFIKGMILVYIIVGILNSIGLFALGIKNPFLFGMLCAVMTIIPYIGLIVSALIPITISWLDTGNIWYPVGIVAVFSVVQYLEANVIFPKVVGTQLHVSTLAMLVAIIAGGIIWGVAGMILFIPFVAILKIVSDHIEEWKPLSGLLSRK